MNKNGITLIALVVTIIVLLILAGVSIALILGPDGMMQKARETRLETRYSSIMDKIYMRDAELAVSFKINEEGEHQKDFILRLLAEKLIKENEDDYDDEEWRTIYLGPQKDGSFKYVINIADATIEGKEVFDDINDLPDANDPGNEHLKYMTLIVATSYNNETVELPISNTSGLTINWDAENTSSVFESPNSSANPTYTYPEANINGYEVQIKGTAASGASFGGLEYTEWPFEYSNYHIIGLKHWGENGFSVIGSLGGYLRNSEIPVPSKYSFANVTTFHSTLSKFEFPPIGKNINDSLEYCVDINTIEGSLENQIIMNNSNPNLSFLNNGNESLTIPSNLFAYCPNVTSFEGLFFRTKIKEIPPRLFANCPNVTNFKDVFKECFLLESIPEGLFENNTKVKTFESLFESCESLTGNIPPDLFANCKDVTSFKAVFAACWQLTGNIPEDLFENCTKVKNFDSVFVYCIGLNGSIPANLFANCPEVTSFTGTFEFCETLTGSIPANLFAACPDVTSFSTVFYYCENLTGSIPLSLFDNNNDVSDFSYAFGGCEKLTGSAPTIWLRGNVSKKTGCFAGCTSLSNYNSIPSNWKSWW